MKNKMSVEIKKEMINGKKHMRINVYGGTLLEKKEMLLKILNFSVVMGISAWICYLSLIISSLGSCSLT